MPNGYGLVPVGDPGVPGWDKLGTGCPASRLENPFVNKARRADCAHQILNRWSLGHGLPLHHASGAALLDLTGSTHPTRAGRPRRLPAAAVHGLSRLVRTEHRTAPAPGAHRLHGALADPVDCRV